MFTYGALAAAYNDSDTYCFVFEDGGFVARWEDEWSLSEIREEVIAAEYRNDNRAILLKLFPEELLLGCGWLNGHEEGDREFL